MRSSSVLHFCDPSCVHTVPKSHSWNDPFFSSLVKVEHWRIWNRVNFQFFFFLFIEFMKNSQEFMKNTWKFTKMNLSWFFFMQLQSKLKSYKERRNIWSISWIGLWHTVDTTWGTIIQNWRTPHKCTSFGSPGKKNLSIFIHCVQSYGSAKSPSCSLNTL